MNSRASPEHRSAGMSKEAIMVSLADHLIYSNSKYPANATTRDWFETAAHSVRDRLVERWMETMQRYYEQDSKRIYYLSLEFLMGRTLSNAMLNLGMDEQTKAALYELGQEFEAVAEIESDAALGNGGLGRLAACFLDSMATLDLPCYGYGIRYEYGMFRQSIESGMQVEHPDNWLRYGNPWEFPRPELLYPVKFGGRVVEYKHEDGHLRHHWVDTDDVMAMAYDTPIPGYGGNTVNNMRLWAAKSSRDFELRYFNQGDYIQAVADKNESENLSKVLYPNDTTEMGRELRLKQQYFFVSASLQDMLYRYKKNHESWVQLPDKLAVQLNDTHPSIGIAEMMRLLVDVHHQTWDEAWSMTTRIFSYTNHTLMPEALETWPVAMFETLLPRHLQIIYEINHRFLQQVMHHFPGDGALLQRLSIIDEGGRRRIRMPHLAIVGSHTVNGVAALHTELMKRTIFADFERIMPGKFVNMTNGVTPRRWLNQANPGLARLITGRIGKGWVTDLDQLQQLRQYADDAEFQKEFRAVKQANKRALAELISKRLCIEIDPTSLFDIQIKRIHEYKRQLLNVLHVITLYNRIRSGTCSDIVPRTVIIAGKSAPGYAMAKLIIRLINDVADIVNNDQQICDRLKLVFIPNYDVSNAERIVPAADLSEQISTAGTEASGTGNMKLALNGALTIGTLDGANIEIREEVGAENFFLFGLTTDEVEALHRQGYDAMSYYRGNAELKQALDMIASGFFCPDDSSRYQEIVDVLLKSGDRFLLLADYAAYVACQDRVGELYRDTGEWTKRAILNVAGMGKFSSDRTIRQYAEHIWHVAPIQAQTDTGQA
ncbi:MAG: glycogen/starch/alpha-glucan phosphorylase [Gammaproteobacteria bacterium]|nr:glycogen/starch/alpha-glucan phosphorylase [Gammaproteobacteria bacterium]MBU1777045.1 glycogen/starch/alpha-glucan phosphorylase [Gammaproteobacteria bacterium]MBU1969098.1 glycogen/starch/alpha-glucan phosphorylase [Gammaproteobacteria bacterium]